MITGTLFTEVLLAHPRRGEGLGWGDPPRAVVAVFLQRKWLQHMFP